MKTPKGYYDKSDDILCGFCQCRTPAERMLCYTNTYRRICGYSGLMIKSVLPPVRTPPFVFWMAQLSIDLYSAPTHIQFRAIMEEWDRRRIVSELRKHKATRL